MESATEPLPLLHDPTRPKIPNRSEIDQTAAFRCRTVAFSLLRKSSSVSAGRDSLAHSARAAAKGSAAASDRFFRKLSDEEEDRSGGGRGRSVSEGWDLGLPEVLGIPGRCSQEKGTEEEVEGLEGERGQSEGRMDRFNRGIRRRPGGDSPVASGEAER